MDNFANAVKKIEKDSCICFRNACTIMCKMCGAYMYGRPFRLCKKHPNVSLNSILIIVY